VAGKAKFCRALMSKHMAVDRSMGIMAGSTSFNSYSAMFVDKRTLLIGVALEASFLLETTELCSCRWAMILVAICTFDHTFSDSMSLVQGELRRNFLMTIQTELITLFG
jgi:hypothetical protein